ncbi:PEPxxWA-CTERM sorting domain-containing protein [Sphingomonas tabacisoli]|uniref:PEPxxWA-CTERM sorting domain-containing protein n=1 Tax=Sphingomonas tabacisoli TaxID=2249466 RepID=A0ABW4I519_9SPHN
MKAIKHAAAMLAVIVPSVAQASPISGSGSLAGANPIYLPASNLTGAGPVAIGGGVSWSSNQSNSLFGWTGGYVTGNATIAPGSPPIIEVNAAYDVASNGYATMTISFAAPTSGFLAELFWTDNEFTAANSANIAIYDSSNALLEFTYLNNNGNSIGLPSNYYGFSRPTADIAYVRLSNSHVGARNLSYVGPTIGAPPGVPEPAAWALMIAGFGLAGAAARTRRRVSFA